MPNKLRRFTKKAFIVCNVIIALLFLLACLAPYLNPAKWWLISFLGFGFVILLVIIFLFIFFWLILSPRYVFISIVALLIGWKSISVFFAFNTPRQFKYEKYPGEIRVVSWNVARFIEIIKNSNKGSQVRLKMMDLIKNQNADILCLQEFHTSTNPKYYDNIEYIQHELNYPYFYFSYDEDGDRLYYSSIIFSRYPIIDSGVIHYPKPSITDALIFADIKFNRDTIRVYTTHLQSFHFKKEDYRKIEEIKNQEDSMIENSRTIFYKLKRAITHRSLQANIIKKLFADSPYPILFCGDLNDVPNSYTYFTIRSNMQDAFLQKGFGIGRTFTGLSPTLRIDYILASKDFSIQQVNRIVKNYSDHYMILSDIKLKQ